MPLGYKLLTTMKAEKSLYNHVWLVMKNVAAVKLFRYFRSMEYLLMSNDASNDASVFSSHLLALSGSKQEGILFGLQLMEFEKQIKTHKPDADPEEDYFDLNQTIADFKSTFVDI